MNITPEQTLQTIKRLDETDGGNLVRRGARSLGPAIQILEQFMAGVAIGIQQSPEISSLVVGGVRLIISLVARFVEFYNRLSEIICSLSNYLPSLEVFTRNTCDGSVIQEALIGMYSDLIKFFHEARLVFVNKDGTIKKLGTFRTFFRVQWQPFDSKFGEIKSRFEHHLSVLQTSAHAQQLNLLNVQLDALHTGFTKADMERQRVQSKEQVEERRKFLEWISTVNHEGDFDTIIKQRHPNTGIWFLEHNGFQKWKNEPHPSLLWCYGTPGAGKSVLASVALDHLTKYELDEEKSCVIFAYYNYRHPERDNPSSLVASFIKQLCSKSACLPEKAKYLYQSHFYNARTPTFEDMEPLLYDLLGEYIKVFIVIDALDECQAPTQENRQQSSERRPRHRQEVLDFLGNLTSNGLFRTGVCAKVLVTSRREEDINDTFKRHSVIEIDATQVDADVKTYLHDELELRIEKGSLKLRDPNLKNHIFSTLSSRAHGMFLWATLQLDWICEQRGDDDILEELERLPQDLCETYDRILERISQKPEKLREVARKALTWVLYALRPISIYELIEAIAIEPSIKSHEALKEKCREEDVIIGCTGALLIVENSYRRIVRPIHASVQEYLTRASKDEIKPQFFDFSFDEESGHGQLAKSCMAYLQLDIFNEGPSSEFLDLYYRRERAAFATYSCSSFDIHILHLSGLPQEIQSQLDLLLSSEKRKLAAVLQCRRQWSFSQFSSEVNAAMIIYSTNIYNVLQRYTPDSDWFNLALPKYCLHEAAGNDSIDAMQRLMELGQKIDERDEDDIAPLYHSAVNGHIVCTKWLLDHGAQDGLQGGDYGTALQAACSNRHLPIVELLLKYNANVNLQSGYYGTALQVASSNGHLPIVELLLNQNASVNLQSGYYGTALQAASYNGHLPIVELLLKHNANVNLQGGKYGTALQAASSNGHLPVVELLLNHNANVNLQGGKYGTALQAACSRGHLPIVELLLNHNANVNLQGGYYGTAVQTACSRGHLPIVELLLNHNANANLQSGYYGTAVQAASSRGHLPIVELLLKHNANVNLHGGYHSTAVQAASFNGHLPVVELLLKHEAKITSGSLSAACDELCIVDTVASLLLENGAKVTAKALENAQNSSWTDRYQMLLDFQKLHEKQALEAIEEAYISIESLFDIPDAI